MSKKRGKDVVLELVKGRPTVVVIYCGK